MRGIRTVGVVSLAIALLASATPVDAALGLKYLDRSRAVARQSRATLNVSCPEGSSVVGGGVGIEGGNTFTRVASSGPFDDADADKLPDDGWEGSISNRTSNNRTMTVTAICAGTGRYRYVKNPQGVPPSTFGQSRADCPAGAVLVGGGGVVEGGGVKTHRYEDRPTDTSDGWQVTVRNDSNKRLQLTTWAICSKSGTYTVYDNSVPLNAESFAQEVAVDCPVGTYVTAGGGLSSSSTMHSTEPTDSNADADTKPDNGWIARFGSPGGYPGLVYVVCKSP